MQMGLVLGAALAFILGTGLHFGAKVFTKDMNVLRLIRIGIPVIYSCSNVERMYSKSIFFNLLKRGKELTFIHINSLSSLLHSLSP